MPHNRPPESWDSFLSELDALVIAEMEFHCFGGFVATILYGVPRTTEDVDILPVAVQAVAGDCDIEELAGKDSPLHKKHKVYVDVVNITPHPDDYAERLTEMFPGAFQNLRILALDPYDLVLMKLERNDRKDRDDVVHIALHQQLDMELLKGRYLKEFRPYLQNEKIPDKTLELWIDMIEEERKKQVLDGKANTK